MPLTGTRTHTDRQTDRQTNGQTRTRTCAHAHTHAQKPSYSESIQTRNNYKLRSYFALQQFRPCKFVRWVLLCHQPTASMAGGRWQWVPDRESTAPAQPEYGWHSTSPADDGTAWCSSALADASEAGSWHSAVEADVAWPSASNSANNSTPGTPNPSALSTPLGRSVEVVDLQERLARMAI